MEALVVAAWGVGEVESVTVAVKLEVPTVVGVPVMVPVLVFSVNPAGSAPKLMEKLYGVVPPMAFSEEL